MSGLIKGNKQRIIIVYPIRFVKNVEYLLEARIRITELLPIDTFITTFYT